jgi:hypothetical protein
VDPLFRTALIEQLGESHLEASVTTDICGKKDSHAIRLDLSRVVGRGLLFPDGRAKPLSFQPQGESEQALCGPPCEYSAPKDRGAGSRRNSEVMATAQENLGYLKSLLREAYAKA